MRIPRRAIPAQPLTYLWERHKEIARRVVKGEKPIDIARDINMTPCRLSIIMNSPAFTRYLDSLRERVEVDLVDIRQEINKGAQKGVGKLLTLMTSDQPITPDDKFRAKLAQDFLDRDGHGKVQKVQTQTTTVVVDARMIEQLKQKRAQQLAASRLNVIDAQLVTG